MGHSQSFVSRVRVWFVCLCVKHFLDLVFFFFPFSLTHLYINIILFAVCGRGENFVRDPR